MTDSFTELRASKEPNCFQLFSLAFFAVPFLGGGVVFVLCAKHKTHSKLDCYLGGSQEPLAEAEWKTWRNRERPSDRRARRIGESIKFLRFASLAMQK